MNKKITYLVVALTMLLVFSYDNILSGDIGSSLIEEIIGFFLLLGGFFTTGRLVEKILIRLDQKWPWNDSPISRFGIDVLGTSLGSLIITALIVLSTWLFFESFGIPKSMDIQEQRKLRQSDPGFLGRPDARMPPPPRREHLGEDRPRPNRNHQVRPLKGIRNRNFAEAYKYSPNILFGSFLLLLIVFLFEESALNGKRKEVERFASMQLAQDQMLSRINALKGQINPHFMFNNLNTLSGLIHEDVDRADRFIHSLSKNLRYVLEQNEEVMVSLENEVDFIKSYIHLQEERFGHKLKIHIDIQKEHFDYQLPALTLELLIENALKHNVVSSTNPLSVNISVDNDYLIVSNTYQPKKEGVISTGIGLKNLKEQLSLLGLEGASFEILGEVYLARIPMLRIPKINNIS